MIRPTSIKKDGPENILITWADGHESRYSFKFLREACPCAACKGESVLLHTYEAPRVESSAPGRYELVGVQQVGSYAMQLRWGDGHDTGIFSWEYLLNCCTCAACKTSKGKQQN